MKSHQASRSIVLLLVAFGFASSAFAQGLPRIDVSGGWQTLRSEGDSADGWYGDVGINLNRVVALVGSIDGLYETVEGSAQTGNVSVNLRAETRIHTFLGGARLNLRVAPGIVPFVELLGGAHRLSGTFTTNITGVPQITQDSSQGDPVLQIGGGVTLNISRALGVRVAVAHRRAFLEVGNGSATRIAAGAVLRF